MLHSYSAGILKRLSLVAAVCLALASCGFHLQGQNERKLPSQLSFYVKDNQLAEALTIQLEQRGVNFKRLELADMSDSKNATLELNKTRKSTIKLVLDENGEVKTWRYTLTSQYRYGDAGVTPISVSTDIQLSDGNLTADERLKAQSWSRLYEQLAARTLIKLSFE